jgi:CBS domain-containing protein
VYDFVPGKVDWAARGLPMEGRNTDKPNAGNLAQRDVATCSPDDTVATARNRAAGKGVCVVVNGEHVVFGVLREKELAAPDDALVSTVMRTGPSTFRPHVSAKEMADYMTKHKLANAPITTSDGRLVGVLFCDIAVRAAESRS